MENIENTENKSNNFPMQSTHSDQRLQTQWLDSQTVLPSAP